MNQDEAKHAAAIAAAALVEPGMLVGLGTGTTMRHAIDELGRRMRQDGLRFTAVPTSLATARQAQALGIPLTDPDADIDLAIDGADEIVAGSLQMIKGLGGALLREKIVAQLAHRLVIVADSSKIVGYLGQKASLPVEVTHFGLAATTRRIAALGGRPHLRQGEDGQPFVTDGGNALLDCPGFAPIDDPAHLIDALRQIAGVIETGLFIGLATQALIAQPDGSVTPLHRRSPGSP